MLKLHSISRDNLYEATATYDEGNVTVLKGSRINTRTNPKFKPSNEVATKRADRSLVDETGTLLVDVEFKSLSTVATFVTGRTSNGMITWKTEDGRYVRYTIKGE